MDNSVYQPLSHALNPAPPAPPHRQSYPDPLHHPSQSYDKNEQLDRDARGRVGDARPVDEEEEEEEEVEGAVVPNRVQTEQQQSTSEGAHARRRPGRPKGSKNKKPRFDVNSGLAKQQFATSADLMSVHDKTRSRTNDKTAKAAQAQSQARTPAPSQQQQQSSPNLQQTQIPTPAPSAATAPPSSSSVPALQPAAVPAGPSASPSSDPNSALHDFQWHVLTLCSEFYNAANELIAKTPPNIVSQCFSLPGNQINPISLLQDARRACDQLMTSPSALILKATPPPPVYKTSTPAATSASPPTSGSVVAPSGAVFMPVSTAGSSVNPTPSTSVPPVPMHPPPVQYAQTYYTYTQQPQASPVPYAAQQQVMKPVSLTSPTAAGMQGSWTDAETERLKKYAEESKTAGSANGDIDWDWVVEKFGNARTRHQILIKATNLNLKASTSRSSKRRRDQTDGPSSGGGGNTFESWSPSLNGSGSGNGNGNAKPSPSTPVPPAPAPASQTGTPKMLAPAAVPERPPSTSTTSASPTIAPRSQPHPHAHSHHYPQPQPQAPQQQQQQQQPPQRHIPTPPRPPGGGTIMHWPMPTIAANTPSPVMSNTTGSRSVYYDQRRGKA